MRLQRTHSGAYFLQEGANQDPDGESCGFVRSRTVVRGTMREKTELSISGGIVRVIFIPRTIKRLNGPDRADCHELMTVVFESLSCLVQLGRHCFRGSNLATLFIPRSVTTIDGFCFSDCLVGLIHVDASNQNFGTEHHFLIQFHGRRIIRQFGHQKEVSIPPDLAIGECSFSCSRADRITFPEHSQQLAELPASSFQKCMIEHFVLPKYVKVLGQDAFRAATFASFRIADNSSLTHIAAGCFAYSRWTALEIPENVKFIGGAAFSFAEIGSLSFQPGCCLSHLEDFVFGGCSITKFSFPPMISFIDGSAFSMATVGELIIPDTNQYCRMFGDFLIATTSLVRYFGRCERVVIPEEVTQLAESSFAHSLVEEVVFPTNSKVMSIGAMAFDSSSLTTMKIPKRVKNIGGCCFRPAGVVETRQFASLTFDDDSRLRRLRDLCFARCQIESLTIPGGVQGIGRQCFAGFHAEHFAFADSSRLSWIGDCCFQDCCLKSLRVPRYVRMLGVGVFRGADIGSLVFQGGSELTKVCEGCFAGARINDLCLPSRLRRIDNECFCEGRFGSIRFERGAAIAELGQKCFEHVFVEKVLWIGPAVSVLPKECFRAAHVAELRFGGQALHRIRGGCFENCGEILQMIRSLTIPGCVERLGRNCFRSSVFDAIVFTQESMLTRIGQGCFQACCLQRPLLLPAGVEVISRCCFEKSKIPSIEFAPDSKLRDIAEFAFAECNIEIIHIPKHVVTIKESAFSRCKRLRTVRFVVNCELAQLRRNCFLDCPLEQIEIPRSVESIDVMTLSGIRSVAFAPGNKNYFQNGCFVFSPSKTTILRFLGSSENCVSIPSHVEVLGPGSFSGCKVGSVSFEGSAVKRIENQAFEYSSLESIAIPPRHVKLLGTGCFASCIHLKYADISECVQLTQLSPFCFSKCGLQSIDIPAFVQAIDSYCFSYCCDLCKLSFAVNSKLIHIRSFAFTHCGLESVCIPKSVQLIEAQAFSHCHGLHELAFDDKSELCQLGESSFAGTGLNQICIPGTVKSIGELCFSSCPELRSVRFEWPC
jgi:hypothetical protein